MYQKGLHIFSLFICLSLGIMSVNAQSTTAANTDWNTVGTWTGSVLPAAGNTVTVSNNITINAAVLNTVGAITIASGGSITMGASGNIAASSITVQSGGTLTLVSGSVMNQGSVTIASGGTLTMTAGGKLNAGSYSNSGTYNSGSGVISNLVFNDNFNRTSGNGPAVGPPVVAGVTAVSNGGVPTAVTYNVYTTQVSGATAPFTWLTGTQLSMVGNSSINYISSSYPTNANFSTTVPLNNNGNLTWYATIKAARSTLPLSTGSMYSAVLAATTTNLTTATLNSVPPASGYAVCLVAGSATGNNLALGYFTGGLSVANFHAFITISNVVAAQAFTNTKVTYNSATGQWGLSYYTNASSAEPLSNTSVYTTASTATDNTYKDSIMTAFGLQEISTSTNTNLFDNFYALASPVIFSATATSGLNYDYIDASSGPSAYSTFTAKAGSLGTNPLIITPPAGYEVSTSSSFTAGSSTASSTTSPAYLSLTPSSGGIVNQTIYFRLKQGLSIATYNGNIVLSSTGATSVNVAVTGKVIAPGPTNLITGTNSDNSQYLIWTAPSNGHTVLVVAYNTTQSVYPTPTSSSPSTYTANTTFGSGSSDGNGGFVVYNGTGTSVDITGLTTGTTYYYQAISYLGSAYDGIDTTTGVPSVVQPVTSLAATSANTQSVISWTNPVVGVTQSNYWDKILVVAYPTSGSISAPTGDGSAYTANTVYGSGSAYGSGYVVYNGTGTTVTVTSLTNLTSYTYAVYARHGSVWSAVTTAIAIPSLYSVNDFVSVANGNYSSTSTWKTWTAAGLVTTLSTPSASSNVWIDNADTVAVSAAASCLNLHVINGTIVAGSYTGSVLTPTIVGSTVILSVAGSSIEVQSGGQIGVPLTNGQTGDNANGLVIYTTATGSSASALATTTISGSGGSINIARLAINANFQHLVISHDVNVFYHASGNNGNGHAFGVLGTASTTWTDQITISSGATVTMGQLAGLSLASSTSTNSGVNFTLNIAGALTFTRGKTPTAMSGSGTNGAMSLNTAAGYTATVNVLTGGSLLVTELNPNGSPTGGAMGTGAVSYYTVAAGGTLTVDSLIDFRNPSETITGAGSFRLQSNNGTETCIKIGSSSGINAQIQTTTQYLTDPKTTFRYEGTVAQVTGTNLPSTVPCLRIANTSSGVTLSQPTTVTDSLKMAGGVLITTPTNLLTIAASAADSVGTTAFSTSYVDGPMAIVVASSSPKIRTFGIGANGVYSPVTLNVTQNTSSARTYIATAYVGGTTPAYSNNTGTIVTIDPKRYYTISSTGSGSVTAAKVTLGYSTAADVNAGINSFITTSASRMRVVGSTGTSWTDLGGTGAAVSTGVGSVTATTNFITLGTFAVANAVGLNASPDLTAAVAANVTANYSITFTDDPAWRSAITSVVAGVRTLTRNVDYTISAGAITIIPNGAIGNLLRTVGTLSIDVNATGYDIASVDQVVTAGAATKLLVHTAPVITTNGAAFSTQPVIYITDAYNNIVSSATDNITPSNNGAVNWTLGGTLTPLATSGGIATFTNLSGASNSAFTATITFTSTLYGSVSSNFSLVAPPTYYWVGGITPAAWNAANVWSTTKGGAGIASYTPSSTDILIFDGKNLGGGITSGTIQTWGPSSTTTVGQIILQNNATVTLIVSPTSAARAYNISGLFGTDLVIGSGSTLNLTAPNTTSITLASGATAAISGNLVMGTAANSSSDVFSSTTSGGIQFNSGSVVTIYGNSGTSPFGSTASNAGTVVFNSGSTLMWYKSGDVFGGNNVVTFNNGSLFYIVYNAAAAQLLMDGHSYGNIEVNNTGTSTSNAGTNGFTCQSLKIDGVSKFVIGSTGGNSTIGSVTLASGSTLTVNNRLVYTTLSNAGTITLNSTTVNLNGTCGNIILNGVAAQTISGTSTVSNFTLNNAAGATVSSGNNSLSITGILTLTSGQLATNDNVTLKSTSVTNTAIVAPVVGSITGKVTVERFIPYGKRTYRDLGPEVSNAGSFYTNWQEGGINNNGYGIQITGSQSLGTGTDPITGFDYSLTGNHSLYTYTNNTWDSISNTLTTNLNPYQGYRVLVRGDRSGSLQTQFLYNTAATLRAKGNLITGTVTMNTSNALTGGVGSYSFIANPYVCPVYWNTVMTGATTGISGSYWYCDPTFTTNQNWGGYTTFVAYNNVSGVSNPLGHSLINGYLQPGQAVFVQNTSASPSLVFTEASKSIAQTKTAIFGTAINRIAVGLNKDGSNVDGAVTAFGSNFSAAIGTEDAIKFPNGGENIAFTFGAKDLCINATVLPTASDVFPIHLYNLAANSAYSLRLDVSQFTGNGVQAYLKDNVSNTKTLLSGDNTIIAFNTNSVDAVNYAKRYSIVFGNSTLQVSDIKLTASVKASTVQVDWSVVGEVAVSNYGVQHSVDGVTFTNIATVTANNSSAYAVTDTKAVTGTNYYRIKVSSIDGTVSYSNVVAVSIGKAVASIAAYPNPLVGQKLNVSFNNLEAGKYSLAVYDAIGKKVVEKSISHIGGTVVEQLSINSHLAAGTYTVHVSNVNGISYQSKVEVK